MSIEALAAELRDDTNFARNVTAWQTLPARQADETPWPSGLDAQLAGAGRALGIDAPYTHQAQAIDAALHGDNVVLATGTASGKTLGYTLPLLNTLLHDPTATALLLFPTKALAHDQITAIQAWISALQAPVALRPYDGDTPQRHRAAIRNTARIIVSNPDMLHLGILPHHTRWMRFFTGLRYIVLDELHTYRGIFGAHVANVLRRLRRIARFYGSDPQFISASATIANAQALGEVLWEAPIAAIETDGAPYGKRHVIFYNPPLLNPELGLRASAAGEAVKLVLRLLHADVQTIVFARSRMGVERLLRELRERAARAGFAPDAIQGYRGGYLPQERRAIERDLREGTTRVVVATNALELGIDIGALDASVLVGYPGSIAATRQQMGRAGRRAGTSLSALIATPAPLDQYLVSHPEYFFGRSPEEARVNPDTLSLLASHLTCAAFELPFECDEGFGKAENVPALLEALSAEGILHRSGRRFTWVGDAYPAQALSLRTATPDNIIVRSTEGGLIGTVDRPSAPNLVHEGAVYIHGGDSYLIESLDWEQGLAMARPGELEYYTVASSSAKVERTALRHVEGNLETGVQRTDEEVLVHRKPTGYRRVQYATHETLDWGEIDLPEQVMETEAFRLTLPDALVETLAQAGVMVAPLDYGPEWPDIRKTILERDGHKCRVCGCGAQLGDAQPGHPLEVHHLTPLRTFLARYARQEALHRAHAAENLLTVCPPCHHKLERARGARTALSGMAYLLQNLAPVFLMCDPRDLGTSVEARDAESGQPAVVVFDDVPGGAGLSPRLVDLWPAVSTASLERVRTCRCVGGCPSCVGPVGESEPGAKEAAKLLLERVISGMDEGL